MRSRVDTNMALPGWEQSPGPPAEQRRRQSRSYMVLHEECTHPEQVENARLAVLGPRGSLRTPVPVRRDAGWADGPVPRPWQQDAETPGRMVGMGRLRSRPWSSYLLPVRGRTEPGGWVHHRQQTSGSSSGPVAYRTATRERIRYDTMTPVSRLALWVGYVCFRLASAAYEPTPGSNAGARSGGTTLGIRVPEGFQVPRFSTFSFVVGHAWHARSRDQNNTQSVIAGGMA